MNKQANKYTRTLCTLCVGALVLASTVASDRAASVELVIGEERIPPGIVIIFEGAARDQILPAKRHLAEDQTDVHIEARVNWDSKKIPESAVPGGFVPYLDIVASIRNENTGAVSFVDLLPHINLIDNFHYARNVALPGKKDDSYEVSFTVFPPSGRQLGLHKDWVRGFGNRLISERQFVYKKVRFKEIVDASR